MQWSSNSVNLGCIIEHSSIEDYKQYMLRMFKKNIERHKEQLLRDKELIRNNRRRVMRINTNMAKAVEVLDFSFKKEMERREKKKL